MPGGGGISTAADLALFYQGLLLDLAGDDRGPGVWRREALADALRVRTGDLVDPIHRKPVNRALGVSVAGDDERAFRGFGHTNTDSAFGHGGAGGQLGWGDPGTGISLGYCTNGFDRRAIRMARRGVGIMSRAASLAL